MDLIFGQVALEDQIVRNRRGAHAVSHQPLNQRTALGIDRAADKKIDIRMGAEITFRQRADNGYIDPVAFSGAQNARNGCRCPLVPDLASLAVSASILFKRHPNLVLQPYSMMRKAESRRVVPGLQTLRSGDSCYLTAGICLFGLSAIGNHLPDIASGQQTPLVDRASQTLDFDPTPLDDPDRTPQLDRQEILDTLPQNWIRPSKLVKFLR